MTLTREVSRVLQRDNCVGCGGCAALFDGVEMASDSLGFLRPVVAEGRQDAPDDVATFRRVCPGVTVKAPQRPDAEMHPVFGPHYGAWRAAATDPDLRRAGSSGGVLSALGPWLVKTGRAQGVISADNTATPRQPVPVAITTREEALRASGSKYCPAALAVSPAELAGAGAIVAKPCEAAALRAMQSGGDEEGPIVLSFFCAGTPSAYATDELVRKLGVDPETLESLRYRGEGWPGFFVARDHEGHEGKVSYHESWGKHLGRNLQSRCKICPDGTGEQADISVGDFWEADEEGFPVFEEGDGDSVAIARTRRGREMLLEAARDGVITLAPASLDDVARIQPLQRSRRLSLAGRVLARTVVGSPAPRYRGYSMIRTALSQPYLFIHGLGGTIMRWRAGQDRLRQLADKAASHSRG